MDKPVCKLIGENGNAFVIIGKVSKTLRRAGKPKEAEEFLKEIKTGDYDHLLQTAMKYVEVE